ncbi:hypothetical protein Nepgr_033253 [Nepenthes gracilis]|uniref:Uncharacterized protein n=1 Tax=Nepenthes gracilis TaxID=150966 RepID=A0AAD3Y888_NEPGR|nr:hypothetical protein Nepgr_033253 [Nepenthes gracilis]
MIIHWESLVWPKELQQLEHDVKHQRVKLQARELQPPDCDYDEAHLLDDKAQPQAFEGVSEALQPLDGEVQQCQPLGEDAVSQPLEGEERELRLSDGEVSNIESKKLPSFDGNGQEQNPHDAKTRESGPLERTEISNSKVTNQTNVAAENSQYNDHDASPAFVANYYARKLLHSFSMFAVDNGKIVLRKEATPTSITSEDSFVRETHNSLVTYGTNARKSTLIKKYFGYFGYTHPSPWKNYSSNQFAEESHDDSGENSPLPLVPFQKPSTSSGDLLTIGRRWLSLRWKRVFSSKSLTRQKIPCSISKQPMRHSSMAIHHDEKHDDNSAQKDDELHGTKGEIVDLLHGLQVLHFSCSVAGNKCNCLLLYICVSQVFGMTCFNVAAVFVLHKEDWAVTQGRRSAGKSIGASHHQHAMSYDTLGRVSSSYMVEDTYMNLVSRESIGQWHIRKSRDSKRREGNLTEALNLDDRYVKAYSHRATARKELGKLKESMDDLDFALRLERQC